MPKLAGQASRDFDFKHQPLPRQTQPKMVTSKPPKRQIYRSAPFCTLGCLTPKSWGRVPCHASPPTLNAHQHFVFCGRRGNTALLKCPRPCCAQPPQCVYMPTRAVWVGLDDSQRKQWETNIWMTKKPKAAPQEGGEVLWSWLPGSSHITSHINRCDSKEESHSDITSQLWIQKRM